MIPGLDLIVYEDDPDSRQSLVLTPLGSVAWDAATGRVWDANYDTDDAVWAAIVDRERP